VASNDILWAAIWPAQDCCRNSFSLALVDSKSPLVDSQRLPEINGLIAEHSVAKVSAFNEKTQVMTRHLGSLDEPLFFFVVDGEGLTEGGDGLGVQANSFAPCLRHKWLSNGGLASNHQGCKDSLLRLFHEWLRR